MADKDLIISVGEARKLLGKRYALRSDAYIERLIKELDEIATAYILMVLKNDK